MERYKNENISAPDTSNAEYQVLADLIANPGYILEARDIIDSTAFSTQETRDAWDILNKMQEKGDTIDIATVGIRVPKQAIIRVMEFSLGAMSPKTVLDHCHALYRESMRRMIYVRASEMLRAASENRPDFDSLIAMPGKLVDAVSERFRAKSPTISVTDALNSLAETLEENQVSIRSGKRTKVPTGLPFLDELIYSGLNPGNLVILAARPSVGKTAVMLHMAKAAAWSGFSATVYSLEMTNEELAQRLLFSSGVETKQAMAGDVDWSAIEKANAMYDGVPLYMNDTCRTLEDITADIILGRHQGRCDIAFIDYLGLIQFPSSRMSLYQAISELTPRLKRVAKECRIPIVLLCQLNRNSETENRSPQLYDLRDSGSIEQDADIVLMLERDSRTLDDRNVNMWVRKNRQGKAGNVLVALRANETFTDFEPRTISREDSGDD